MRLLRILLLSLLCAPAALTQSKPVVRDERNFGLHVVDDAIRWHRYVEAENRLLLVGYKNLQIIDVGQRKVLETRPVTLPTFDTRGDYSTDDWTISPDGRWMLILGHPDAMQGLKQTAWVWDLQTGKRAAVLEKSRNRIRTGAWSENGKSLVTFDYQMENHVREVSFWDGETFEHRGSFAVENMTWWHLSRDGRRFLAAFGKRKSVMGMKLVKDEDAVIKVWDTASGQVLKTITVGDENYSPRTSKSMVSPDDSFLIMVNEHRAGASQHKLLAWEIGGDARPLYEVKPEPKVDNSRVSFSPGGKYFAVDVGKNLQIYETRTGKLVSELQGAEWSDIWLNDEIIMDVQGRGFFNREKSDRMKAVEVGTGRVLYEQALEFSEGVTSSPVGENETYIVYETIRPHPSGDVFLKYDDKYARVFDSRTGRLLQTFISPPPRLDKDGKPKLDKYGKPKLTNGAAIESARWSKDGKTLYVFSANRQSVALWEFVED